MSISTICPFLNKMSSLPSLQSAACRHPNSQLSSQLRPRTVYSIFSLVATLSAFQCLVSGNHSLAELDHECGALVPVYSDLGREATVGEDGLNNPGSEGCTIQGAVLFRNRDVRVDKWLFFNDVVGLVIIISLLQLVCFLAEQGFPHRNLWRRKETIKEDGGRGLIVGSCKQGLWCTGFMSSASSFSLTFTTVVLLIKMVLYDWLVIKASFTCTSLKRDRYVVKRLSTTSVLANLCLHCSDCASWIFWLWLMRMRQNCRS